MAGLAAGLGALALAGCGSTAASNSAVTVSGKTLSIYASQPPDDAGGQAATDVLDAEKLAFQQSGGKVGAYALRLDVVHGPEISDDARQAVSDNTAVAYLGEIPPGTSGVSVQITNELGLLQVSPTDTAVYLTQKTPVVSGAPGHFYPSSSSFHRTFARVVPNTAAEAKALAKEMHARHLTKLYVGNDGSDYGASIALEVKQDAPSAGLSVVSAAAGADAVFYAGMPGAAATKALDAAATASPGATLFAPSALYDDTFVAGLSAAAQRHLYVSAPGFMATDLTPSGRQFVATFTRDYGHAPAPQAIFGYAAMKAVLAVLSQAGSKANSRSVVVDDFLTLHNVQSPLGTYSISGGDTTIAPFVIAHPAGGRLVPRGRA